jgi:two-component system alkaline phosphatase synthesis response regulator PhoP
MTSEARSPVEPSPVRAATRVVVVEDEENLARMLCERLAAEGYVVRHAATGEAAVAALRAEATDLVLLDVGLPDISGFDLAPRLRRLQPGAAFLFVTAYSSPDDRIRGLELGAEDYIGKPFHFRELVLRMRRVHERALDVSQRSQNNGGRRRIGVAVVDCARFELERDGVVHTLTHKECAVLQLLLDAAGEVVSRNQILDRAWSPDEYPTPRTVDNFILRLRKLIERDPQNPQAIRSIRGVGYRLTADPEDLP